MTSTLIDAVTTALTEAGIAWTGDADSVTAAGCEIALNYATGRPEVWEVDAESDSTRLADVLGGIQVSPRGKTAAEVLAQTPEVEPRERSITYRFPLRSDQSAEATDYLNLSVRHDSDRKQYTATLSVTTVAMRNGFRTERFSLFGPSVQVLRASTARFSRKAFDGFASHALDAARACAADPDSVVHALCLNPSDGARS
jgi:hypothetical protein